MKKLQSPAPMARSGCRGHLLHVQVGESARETIARPDRRHPTCPAVGRAQRVREGAVVGTVAGCLDDDVALEAEEVAQPRTAAPCRHPSACTSAPVRRGRRRRGRTRDSGRRPRPGAGCSPACWGPGSNESQPASGANVAAIYSPRARRALSRRGYTRRALPEYTFTRSASVRSSASMYRFVSSK